MEIMGVGGGPCAERHDWELLVDFAEDEPRRLHLQMVVLVHGSLVNGRLPLIKHPGLQFYSPISDMAS